MDPTLSLREVIPEDIAVFFVQEQDPEARKVAASTSKPATDRKAFDARWARLVTDETVTVKTVMLGDDVIGYVAAFERNVGQREVAYWIGRAFWGRHLATQALTLFLAEFTARPLYARASFDHAASLRVLEKCGFVTYGRGRMFSEARGAEIERVGDAKGVARSSGRAAVYRTRIYARFVRSDRGRGLIWRLEDERNRLRNA